MSPKALIPGLSRRQMLSVLAALPLVSGSLLRPDAVSAQAATSVTRFRRGTMDHKAGDTGFRRRRYTRRLAGFRAARRAHRHLRQ